MNTEDKTDNMHDYEIPKGNFVQVIRGQSSKGIMQLMGDVKRGLWFSHDECPRRSCMRTRRVCWSRQREQARRHNSVVRLVGL